MWVKVRPDCGVLKATHGGLISMKLYSLAAHAILLPALLLIASGCSVYMAAKQPDAKDLSVLKPGMHRSRVIAEFGAPVWSGEKDGEKTDVFVFKHGYGAGARTGRALFHATADVFTLGLWEVISTPTEAYFSGSELKVEVVYDSRDLVKSSTDLTGENPEMEHKPQTVEQHSPAKAETSPAVSAESSPDSKKVDPILHDQARDPPSATDPASRSVNAPL